MAFRATDGKTFSHSQQWRKYQDWLDQNKPSVAMRGAKMMSTAPGGEQHIHDMNLHGPITELHYKVEDGGRHSIRAIMADGYTHESTHPESYVAHHVLGDLMGVNPPLAVNTLKRSRAHPVGPKETERVAKEDGREVDEGGEVES